MSSFGQSAWQKAIRREFGTIKSETLARSYHPITLLNCLGKVLGKMIQRRPASLIADTVPKQQFGGHAGFSMANILAKLIGYTEITQSRDRVTSVLAIDNKDIFDNVLKGLLRTASDIDLPVGLQVLKFMSCL